jgi:GNAT superfamily N-acetyltransferase
MKFILPEYQGKGYGKLLFKELEKNVNKEMFQKIFLYASLASVNFYLKNDYLYKSFNKYELPDKKYLCYFEMEKSVNCYKRLFKGSIFNGKVCMYFKR